MTYYDEEAIYQDADVEQAELEAAARRISALKKRGVCTHGGWMGRPANGQIYYPEQADLKPGQVRCTELCQQTFDSEEDLLEARAAVL